MVLNLKCAISLFQSIKKRFSNRSFAISFICAEGEVWNVKIGSTETFHNRETNQIEFEKRFLSVKQS
ncbi:hypothetical protein L596_025610 [Steinernema carpocapsae]|uniref:Uncharacterized protein n=1 Tax=Steinernema carpocapsae TaxID=34508 RepID=A0A4V6XVS2_STECR|nr:hypothetical protein L596_025610 [Steinernema carpocapsae]